MPEYYDGTKLLSLMDIDGNKPELFLVTTNRTGGKTTWFGRYCVKKFLNGEGKFALLLRFNYEIDSIADKFFKDIAGSISKALDIEINAIIWKIAVFVSLLASKI